MRIGDEIVKGRAIRFFLALSIFAFLTMSNAVEARSFGDFLKALGNSIAHPPKHPQKRSSERKSDSKSTSKSASSLPSPTAGGASATPTPLAVRTASAAPPARGKKRDVPYGIPVPGKSGFVTSPFAPDGGFVDVRGFPPGTEVKDPYTGKIFLTP
jgi:hypothetical protein